MKTEVTLKKDLPGIPKGTKSIIQTEGIYTFECGKNEVDFESKYIREYPDWFEVKEIPTQEDVIVGQYRQDGIDGTPYRVMEVNEKITIRFIDTSANSKLTFDLNEVAKDPLLTPYDVQLILADQAVKRGYKVGTTIKTLTKGAECKINNDDFTYNDKTDSIYANKGSLRIYCQGNWVAIVEPKKARTNEINEAIKKIQEAFEMWTEAV